MAARFTLIFITFFSLNCQAEKYHLVSIACLFEQQVGELVLPAIYNKLGIDITITAMPGNRAMLETVSGRKDGEIMRIWSYGIEHTETIRIPTPYYQLETMAFFRQGEAINLKTAADLARYSVLKVRGVKHTNNITKGLSDIYDYDDTESMMRALQRNSVALTHITDGQFAIRKAGLKGIVQLEAPLATFPLFHYVHRKNSHLVERLNKAIVEMKQSGELKRLILKAEQEVFQRLEC